MHPSSNVSLLRLPLSIRLTNLVSDFSEYRLVVNRVASNHDSRVRVTLLALSFRDNNRYVIR